MYLPALKLYLSPIRYFYCYKDPKTLRNDGRWKMGDGRWEMEDGRWKMEDVRWEMEDGRWG